jgi:hypothetical protein
MPWPWNKCKNIISYDATSLSFSGLQAPDQILDFKLGAFQIKKELLQTATDIAQMYDMFQFSNCQKIQQLSKDSPIRDQFILEAHRNEERLLEFLTMLRIAQTRPSEEIEKALADWIAFTFVKKLREEAPIIPEKVRAGEIVRESPPIEEYNQIKRSITKAKMTSDYLKEALEEPKFDINKVYTLSIKEE